MGDFPESLTQAMLVGCNVSREIGRRAYVIVFIAAGESLLLLNLNVHFEYGFYYHFNNLRFRNSLKKDCVCVFETCRYVVVSSESMKCRLLK